MPGTKLGVSAVSERSCHPKQEDRHRQLHAWLHASLQQGCFLQSLTGAGKGALVVEFLVRAHDRGYTFRLEELGVVRDMGSPASLVALTIAAKTTGSDPHACV